jgi:hypothetical protein
MPENKILRWAYVASVSVYTVGYFVYLTVLAVAAWPRMTFWDWCVYVSWESLYAMVWPILIFVR